MPSPTAAKSAMELELEKLRAENAALKSASEKALTLKVSEKGAVSVYGMGRFPVTLYAEQWTKLLEAQSTIKAFIEVNRKNGRIVSKADRAAKDAASVPLAPAPAGSSAL